MYDSPNGFDATTIGRACAATPGTDDGARSPCANASASVSAIAVFMPCRSLARSSRLDRGGNSMRARFLDQPRHVLGRRPLHDRAWRSDLLDASGAHHGNAVGEPPRLEQI